MNLEQAPTLRPAALLRANDHCMPTCQLRGEGWNVMVKQPTDAAVMVAEMNVTLYRDAEHCAALDARKDARQ